MRDSNSRSVAACQIHVPVYLPVVPHKSRPNLSRSHALNAGLRFEQPPAREPHGWRTETTNLKLKEEANRGLLAGVRSLRHVILVEPRRPSILGNGTQLVRADRVSLATKPAYDTPEFRGMEKPLGLSHREPPAHYQVGENLCLRIMFHIIEVLSLSKRCPSHTQPISKQWQTTMNPVARALEP